MGYMYSTDLDLIVMSSSSSSLPSKPPCIVYLYGLLTSDPVPKEIGIAILRIDGDDDDKPDEAATGSSATTKSTGPFIVKEGPNLGIHAGDLPILCRQIRRYYYKLRRLQTAASVQRWYHDEIIQTTSCLLLCCPDNSTAWADRKRAIEFYVKYEIGHENESFAITLKSELSLLDLLFSQHSKAPSSWAHRKWINRLLVKAFVDTHTGTEASWNRLFKWADHEVMICAKVAESFPKNYYAWTHRITTMKILKEIWSNHGGQSDSSRSKCRLYMRFAKELEFIETWVKRHVSDHCAIHYGSEIMRIMIMMHRCKDAQAKKIDSKNIFDALNLISSCLSWIKDLLAMFPSHEVIWRYRRLCALLFVETISYGYGSPNIRNDQLSTTALREFLNGEVNISEDSLESQSLENKDVHASIVLARSHTIWVLLHMKRLDVLQHLEVVGYEDMLLTTIAYQEVLKDDDRIVHNFWSMSYPLI